MTKLQFIFHALIVAVIGVCTQTHAAIVIDQVSNGETNLVNFISGLNFQQSVTTGVAGQLVGIDLRFWQTGTATVYISKGSAWQSTPYDFSTTINVTNITDWTHIDVSTANINFDAGDEFVFGLPDTNIATVRGADNDVYTYGSFYLNGSSTPFDNGKYDILFRTYVDGSAAAVPEPATWLVWSLIACAATTASALKKKWGRQIF